MKRFIAILMLLTLVPVLAYASHRTISHPELGFSAQWPARNDVMKETQRKQVPWEHSALTGRFYFKPSPLAPGVTGTAGPLSGSGSTANLLLMHTFEWIDNGTRIGTITFTPDGRARDTWSPLPNTWKIDTNGDLIITNYAAVVTRLTFVGTAAFSGRRDPTSTVQDGVQTLLRAL